MKRILRKAGAGLLTILLTAAYAQLNIDPITDAEIRHFQKDQILRASNKTRPNGPAESSPGLKPKADALGNKEIRHPILAT